MKSAHVGCWHIASFRCVAEFGPLLGHSGLRRAVSAANLRVQSLILRPALSSRMHCFACACNDKCLRQSNTTGKSVPSLKSRSSPSRKNISVAASGKSEV
jgi:hypothetical protein